jgi:hypothetical protein
MPRLSMIEGVGSVTTGFFMAEFARADARRFGQRSISERSTPPTESFVELGAGIGSGDLGRHAISAIGALHGLLFELS